MPTIAVIDMGTNTFHLLVVAVDASGRRVLHRACEAVRIGVAGINEGIITKEACARAIGTMKRFRKTVDEFGVSTVHAFATSAFRNAKNGQSLASEIKEQTGITVEIISGDAEATYIYEGVRSAIEPERTPDLIVDIGAGSVEFIIGNSEKIQWKRSFEIGGQRLVEKYHRHDPILPEEIGALDDHLARSLGPLFTALDRFKPDVLIGSSGTFDTLSDIFCIRSGISLKPAALETPLTLEGFYDIYADIIAKDREERMKIPGMIELRVDLVVVGCCLIRFLLEKHRFSRIRVSRASLKEGVLAMLLRKDAVQ